jgi:lipopolysaccharide/colanic/teichoic acid biosynthesis glycosyltransferase
MLKRLFDIVVSFLGIIILLPLLLIVAVLIVLDSKGGIFYIQKRVGKNNKDFSLYKFRTMHVNSDKKGLITIGAADPRVTKAGLFLRKYKLDELPQLFNVLFGDMSFVGPRPEVRKYVSLYNKNQLKVLSIRPGITDLASIEFRNENELLDGVKDPETYYINNILPAKLELNLKYISKSSFLYDIGLILKTLKSIVVK